MRLLFYSPDSYGLGHVRRTIALAEVLLGACRHATALVLTGAPRAHFFRYPPRCDYVKLPSVTKNARGEYVSRELDLPLEGTIALRRRLILEAAASFRPDVCFVDHSPAGLCGEALPLLELLQRERPLCLRLLAMRDVIDEPEAVRRTWAREGVLEILERDYDRILIFGQQELFDPVDAYGFSPIVAAKTIFAGYIARRSVAEDPQALRGRYAARTGRLVVVALGGGGDGNVLLRSFLEGYARLRSPEFEVVAITGPLMSPGKRARFCAWGARLPGVQVLEHVEDPPAFFEAADAVVAMGGYNTICELAAAGARAVVVPRVFPRREQLWRARLLEARGLLRCLPPEEATPQALVREVQEALARPRPPRGWGLDFGGLERAVALVRTVRPARRKSARRCTEAAS